jgi:hypothetical protein
MSEEYPLMVKLLPALLLLFSFVSFAKSHSGKTHTHHSSHTHHSVPAHKTHTSQTTHRHRTRSTTARTRFQRQNPCPATGKKSGPCPGYVVDHKQALKRGGADAPSNMQWQTQEAAKAKDRVE